MAAAQRNLQNVKDDIVRVCHITQEEMENSLQANMSMSQLERLLGCIDALGCADYGSVCVKSLSSIIMKLDAPIREGIREVLFHSPTSQLFDRVSTAINDRVDVANRERGEPAILFMKALFYADANDVESSLYQIGRGDLRAPDKIFFGVCANDDIFPEFHRCVKDRGQIGIAIRTEDDLVNVCTVFFQHLVHRDQHPP